MSIRTLLATLTGLLLFASFTPALALAQTNCAGNNTWWNGSWNNSSAACTPGTVVVYVQVQNSNYGNTPNRVPNDFTVSVTGATASPSSFPGSLSGTSVNVQGAYTVQAMQMPGYSASYSQGCSGSVINNESASCIITENNTVAYNQYPYSYYPNQYYPTPYYPNSGYVAPLACSPTNQTVTIGQSITFTATGGEFSQFNWSNSAQPNQTSYNIGRNYTAALNSPGVNTITVYNGSQTATCSVNVVGYPVAFGMPGIAPIGTTYPGGVTLTPTYVPALPNTGFEPQDGAAFALAAVLLMVATLIAYPYVRKAFAVIVR